VLTVPLALIVVDYSKLDLRILLMLLALGILSSAVPYSLDTFILRRLTPRLYAVITSFGPVVATIFGVLVLGERFTVVQLIGILVVCAAAGITIATQRDQPRSELEQTAEAVP
jgi:inner membrane transporter RhtA